MNVMSVYAVALKALGCSDDEAEDCLDAEDSAKILDKGKL